MKRKCKNSLSGLGLLFSLAIVCLLLGSCDLNALLKQGSTKKTAILYGISIYHGPLLSSWPKNLKAPVLDIDSMQSLLQSQGWNVIARKDSAATVANLNTDVATVQASLEAGQRVMFYFSGHGTTVPDGYPDSGQYIVPYGTVSIGGVVDTSTALNPARLAAIFQPLADRQANLVFMLDSCYSGGFVANGTYSSDLPPDYSTSPYLGGKNLAASSMLFQSIGDYFSAANQGGALAQPNVWVISAAGSNEASYEEDLTLNHGIFTYAVLIATNRTNGFMNADYNHDNFITLQELYRFSKEWIDANWNTYSYDGDGLPSQYLPHLSGNPLDILIFH